MKLSFFNVVMLAVLVLCESSRSLAVTASYYEESEKKSRENTYLAQSKGEIETEKLFFVEFPEMIFSSNSSNAEYNFVRFTHIIEAVDEEGATVIKSKTPEALDEIHKYFRNEHPDGLAGPDGVYRLKEVLFDIIGDVMQPTPIQDILIQELLVQ